MSWITIQSWIHYFQTIVKAKWKDRTWKACLGLQILRSRNRERRLMSLICFTSRMFLALVDWRRNIRRSKWVKIQPTLLIRRVFTGPKIWNSLDHSRNNLFEMMELHLLHLLTKIASSKWHSHLEMKWKLPKQMPSVDSETQISQ